MVSMPKPPDPYKTAEAQGSENLKAAQSSSIIGNPNEVNPYGSLNYSLGGMETVYDAKGKPTQVPRYTRTVTLSPEQQGLFNLQNQASKNLGELAVSQSGRLQGLLGHEMTTEGLRDWSNLQAPEAYDREAYSAERDQTVKALMDRYNAQKEPQRAAEQAQLAARGLNAGSQGYGTVQAANARADTDAAMQAFLTGGQEQSRMLADERAGYTQQMQYAQFGDTQRGQQFAETAALRNQPINEITALMSGSQVTTPSFQGYNAPNVATTPIGGYIQDNFNAKSQQAQATNAGIFGLGSALAGGIFGAGGMMGGKPPWPA